MDLFAHPLLIACAAAATTAVISVLLPPVRVWIIKQLKKIWSSRPSARRARLAEEQAQVAEEQRAQIMESIAALAEENKRVNTRLTEHLDKEDVANTAMVTIATVDGEARQSRQDEIDNEFRSVDSRFERVEGRLDAAVAEVTGELAATRHEVAATREEMARLAGAVGVLVRRLPD